MLRIYVCAATVKFETICMNAHPPARLMLAVSYQSFQHDVFLSAVEVLLNRILLQYVVVNQTSIWSSLGPQVPRTSI